MKELRVVGVIPARWGATRLPGKMLADIGGKPLIVRTLESARKATTLQEVLVATDDERIAGAVRAEGGQAVLTDPELPSGSDRVYAAMKGMQADVVVNLQGDEPLMPADVVDSAVRRLLEDEDIGVSTAAAPLGKDELHDPNVVKVVVDSEGRALYFSRAPIPYPRGNEAPGPLFRRHVGIYVYRRDTLADFCSWTPTSLERCERLEQLRLLEHGVRIGVVDVRCDSIGVDTKQDLERVRGHFA